MLEKNELIEITKLRKNKITERLYFEVFCFLIKSEFLYKKIKNKEHYIRLKNISFHVTKTELKETYQMIKLLTKRRRTKDEQKFIQEQLKDLWRIWIVGTVWVVPWWIILGIILQKLWLKYSVSAYDEFKDKEK